MGDSAAAVHLDLDRVSLSSPDITHEYDTIHDIDTRQSSSESTPASDTGLFDLSLSPSRPELVSRFSAATTVDEGESTKALQPLSSPRVLLEQSMLHKTLSPTMSATAALPPTAMPQNSASLPAHPDPTSNLVLALLHALEADPADIASKLHALDAQQGGTPSLQLLTKQGIIPLSASVAPPASHQSPDSPNEAIVASIARIAQRLSRHEEAQRELSSSSNNTTPSTDIHEDPNTSTSSVTSLAASAAGTTSNAVSRLIGLYNNKAAPSSSSAAPPFLARRTSSSSSAVGTHQATPPTPLPTQIQGDGSVRPDKEGENEEDERLCHRCGGHIIRANEVGLADEEVIDGQSESLSAEKELKLLKAQVQDFARVCKVGISPYSRSPLIVH